MRIALLLALLVIFSGVVLAVGEMRTLDFSNSTYQLVQIGSRDGVRFDWGGANEKFVIREISKEKKLVDVTVFIEGADVPHYATMVPGSVMELDFESDKTKDMMVSFVKFEGDAVVLLFEKINEPEPVAPPSGVSLTGWFTKVFSKGPFRSAYYNLAGLLIVVIIILVLIGSSRFIRRKYRRWTRSMRLG